MMHISKADDILQEARWERAPNYSGQDWGSYSIVASINRDSDALERVNFEAARKLLSQWEGEEVTPTPSGDIPCPQMQVTIASANHWAVGWVQSLMIHKEAPEAARIEAADIIASLADYPCLDDEALCNLENEEARETWEDCLGDREKIRIARSLGIETPNLAARWGYHIMLDKTDGRVAEHLRG